MYSPRPPPFYPISPSSSHPTSFSSVTDPTLHRQGWQSPRAKPEERRVPIRKIPSRFRALLRYDALSPPPLLTQDTASRTNSAGAWPASRPSHTPVIAPRPPSRAASGVGEEEEDGAGFVSTKRTNLDELKWFQHRWLDKHGKNSHLKESREKMALLRRWFDSLDADGSGEVGLDELEDPLVSVGLARSRDEVQRLIDQVDKDGSGEVTFTEFLRMMNPEKPKRARHRQPLHQAKARLPTSSATESETASLPTSSTPRRAVALYTQDPPITKPGSRRHTLSKSGNSQPSSNPVVKLFEDMQSGKLGDLAIPFPVLITAYRRRMLLNAHMSDDPTARRLGSSVLQALESTRYDGLARDNGSDDDRRQSSNKTQSSVSSSSYLKNYMHSASESQRSATTAVPTQLPAL